MEASGEEIKIGGGEGGPLEGEAYEGDPADFPQEPTLENATFKGTNVFWVKDYVHGGENENLKKEMVKTGRSW